MDTLEIPDSLVTCLESQVFKSDLAQALTLIFMIVSRKTMKTNILMELLLKLLMPKAILGDRINNDSINKPYSTSDIKEKMFKVRA